MDIPLLNDLIIIFALSVGVLTLSHRAGIPTIVGLLFTGILAGPHGLGLVSAVREVEILAEIGVVLLLFTIGIEFSLQRLLEIKKSAIFGGSLQVVTSILAVAGVAAGQLGFGLPRSIFLGFLVSLSSTAIVLKILQEKAEIEAPHGRMALSVLIFQDVAVVPMMLLVPYLAGGPGQFQGALAWLLVKAAGIIALVAVSAKWIVPRLLLRIAQTRSRELFLLSVLLICFGVAWLTHKLGLSLALGAFLAGLIISESEYSHQTMANILPFRDVFTGLFFVSIGMLLNIGYLAEHFVLVGLVAPAVIVLKSFLVTLVVLILGYPLRTGLLTGLSLAQIGEFSFILALVGLQHGLLSRDIYQLFLSVSVLTMGLTPFLITAAHPLADLFLRLPLPKKLKTGFSPPMEAAQAELKKLQDHLVIIGFGLNGRNLTRAALAAGIPHIIIEMNPDTVHRELQAGTPIFYGDAAQDSVLEHARIAQARIMVVAISDPVATRRIVVTARRLNPKLSIMARTRFFQEIAPLTDLGANVVVPEEFETSVEIFSRVLAKYLVPRDEIERFIAEVRSDGYQMFRKMSYEAVQLCDLASQVPELEVSTIRLSPQSTWAGLTLAEIGLRRKYGLTLVAVQRNGSVLANPEADTRILGGDILILLGSPEQTAALAGIFSPTEEKGPDSPSSQT